MVKKQLLILGVIGFVSLSQPGRAQEIDAHLSVKEKFCTVCHVKMPLNPTSPSPGSLKFDINILCNSSSCHNSGRAEHKVGVPSDLDKYERLPLNFKGEIDCETCHDSHNKSHNRMLLRKEPKDLCLICHKK